MCPVQISIPVFHFKFPLIWLLTRRSTLGVWPRLQKMEFLRCSSASVVPFIWILLLIPSIASAQRPPALFVFGDSLSDPGNNNFIRTLSKADSPPNGIDFPGGFATGRYCNGRTTVDILGNSRMYHKFHSTMLMPIVIAIHGIRLAYTLHHIVLFCRSEGWKARVFGTVSGT